MKCVINNKVYLELSLFAQNHNITRLSWLERETWLLSFLMLPPSTDACISNDNTFRQTWIEMESDISTVAMSQVNSESDNKITNGNMQ